MRTNPRPTPEGIALYYPDDYQPYVGTRVQRPAPRSTVNAWLQSIARQIFRFNGQRLPPTPKGRLLEIGCASGAFLHEMAGKGWHVEGIEFSPNAAQAARSLGYHVRTSSLENVSDVTSAYDLVVGWMVLEHLHDPVAALQKLRSWTRPGAYLAMSTPNAGSWERALFGDRWFALQLPTHLYHYTSETLSRVLQQGGWRIERVFHQRVLGNLIASVGYALEDWGRLPRVAAALTSFPAEARLLNYLLYPLALPLAAMGQTGRMTAWARRIDD